MENQRLERLTERQRECLLLVYTHHTIIEIAGKVGLSVEGVNYHLAGARRALGASSSAQAARIAYGDLPPADYILRVALPYAVGVLAQSASFGPTPADQASAPVVREDRAFFGAVLRPDDAPAPPSKSGAIYEKDGLLATLSTTLDWASRIAGIILIVCGLVYAASRGASWAEAVFHIHPR